MFEPGQIRYFLLASRVKFWLCTCVLEIQLVKFSRFADAAGTLTQLLLSRNLPFSLLPWPSSGRSARNPKSHAIIKQLALCAHSAFLMMLYASSAICCWHISLLTYFLPRQPSCTPPFLPAGEFRPGEATTVDGYRQHQGGLRLFRRIRPTCTDTDTKISHLGELLLAHPSSIFTVWPTLKVDEKKIKKNK